MSAIKITNNADMNGDDVIKVAAAINSVLLAAREAGHDQDTVVAALEVLQKMAPKPGPLSLSGCNFTTNPPKPLMATWYPTTTSRFTTSST